MFSNESLRGTIRRLITSRDPVIQAIAERAFLLLYLFGDLAAWRFLDYYGLNVDVFRPWFAVFGNRGFFFSAI